MTCVVVAAGLWLAGSCPALLLLVGWQCVRLYMAGLDISTL